MSTAVAEHDATSKRDADGNEVIEDESKYLSGWKLAPLTFGLCMATFVVALDNTVSTMLSQIIKNADQCVRSLPLPFRGLRLSSIVYGVSIHI